MWVCCARRLNRSHLLRWIILELYNRPIEGWLLSDHLLVQIVHCAIRRGIVCLQPNREFGPTTAILTYWTL